MTHLEKYLVGTNMGKGAHASVIEAVGDLYTTLPMSSVQIDARIASPAIVQAIRASTRVFARAGYFEAIPDQWVTTSALFAADPTGVIFKARAPLNIDAIAHVLKTMRDRGVASRLLIELPAGSCSADTIRECIDTLGARPTDIGFCLNTAIMHSSGAPIQTARDTYNALAHWPVEYLALIYLNGVHRGGGTTIPHADNDIVWGGELHPGIPDLPWAEPPSYADQKMLDIRASGAGLIMKYARHHNIPIILETRASHNQEDIVTFIRSCGRI